MDLCVRTLLYNMEVMERLETVFSALSDPTRLALLDRLAQGEATVMELAAPFAVSQPAISRHLMVLEQAGLISRRVDGSKRPCRLEPKGLEAIDPWLEMMRKAFSQNYRRLDTLLASMPKDSGAQP